jgi:PAS domain S-box-containing protein
VKDTLRLLANKGAIKSSKQFCDYSKINPHPIIEVDSSGEIYFLNPAAKKLFPSLEKSEEKHPFLFNLDSIFNYFKENPTKNFSQEIRIKDSWFNEQVYYFQKNQHARIYVRDITQDKLNLERTVKITKLYSAISKANEAIIRAKDEQSLFNDLCKIVSEIGNFPLVWIGKIVKSEVKSIASYGSTTNYLNEITIKTKGILSKGPIGTCIRKNKEIVFNDFDTNPLISPWHKYVVKYNFKSVAAFPLRLQNKLIGVLTLYSPRSKAFDTEKVKLLIALCADISYALDTLHHEKLKDKAEKALQESEEKYRHLIKYSPIAIFEIDLLNNKFISANEIVYKTLGYTEREFLNIKPDNLLSAESKKSFIGMLEKVKKGKPIPSFAEYKLLKKNGDEVWGDTSVKFKYDNGKIVSALVVSHDITERKKIEEELHRFSQAVEQSSASIIITDLNGSIQYVNRGFINVTGYSQEEAIGKNPRILKSGQMDPKVYTELWDTITSGKEWKGELCNKKKNGELYWEQVSISPIKNSEGKIINYLGVKNDITSKKKSEERINEVFRDIEAGYYEHSVGNSNGFISKKGIEILGAKFEDFSSYSEFAQWFNKHIHKDDLKKYKKHTQDFYSGKIPRFDIELRFLGKDNSWLFLRIVSSPLQKNPQGLPSYVAGIIFNITNRRTSEEALRINKEQLNLALSAAKMGTFIWDIAKDIRIWDENVYRLFGIKPGSYDGTSKSFLQMVYPDDRNKQKNDLAKAIKASIYDTDYRVIWPNGRIIYISARGKVYYDKENKPIKMIAICWDITERKNLDQRKDDFITIAGHELRTPISAIKIMNQILQEMLPNNPQALEYLRKIEKQATIQANLINDLLNVSKMQTGKFEINKGEVDLQDLIKETVDDVQETACENKITIEETAPAKMFTDQERIRQVLVNLCSNAIKFSPKGRRIIVKLKTDQKEAVVSVTDYGIGIPKTYQNRIFEKFYHMYGRGNKSYPGLGMGLYISREIIKLLNGKMWFESAPKKGSTFYFSLPFRT